MKVEIDPRQKITKNAAKYYEKSKKYKNKIEGAKQAIEETKKQIKKIKEKGIQEEKEPKMLKKTSGWYTKYRWCKTTNDYLVIAGKNAEQNEKVVKNHLEKNDLYFHTLMPGAPSTILKNGKEAPEEDKKQAATFAASYSSAWKKGLGIAEVYHVEPEQVKTSAKSGEYLPTGSFRIEGKKNFHKNTELNIALTLIKGKLQAAPEEAIKSKTKDYVLLKPGNTEKNKASKLIKSILEKKFNVKLDTNWVLEKMPPNGCRIVKQTNQKPS